tara:strand:+ start:860 stop:1129 length:270 start_codon:yes stop_codon:yes gene_type:complete
MKNILNTIKNEAPRFLQVFFLVALGYAMSYYLHVYTVSERLGIPQKCIAQHNFMITLIGRLQETEQDLDSVVEKLNECGIALLDCGEEE